ncbi:hypothetical protein C2U70_01895 [Bradyrhizobium guangdongense]|nr:hypothetical protein C2U70_01895 [Bradyrhizobium guangdongense]
MWTLTPRKGLCDTRGGTTANFLHTTAPRDKSAGLPRGKRDCVDRSLDKLSMVLRKALSAVGLSGWGEPAWDMLMDVKKRRRTG